MGMRCEVSSGPDFGGKTRRAMKDMYQTMRRNWKLARRTDKELLDLSRMFNPVLRGWITYYGRFYQSAMTKVGKNLDFALVRWVQRKYKIFQGHRTRASKWLRAVPEREPTLFAHWELLGMRP